MSSKAPRGSSWLLLPPPDVPWPSLAPLGFLWLPRGSRWLHLAPPGSFLLVLPVLAASRGVSRPFMGIFGSLGAVWWASSGAFGLQDIAHSEKISIVVGHVHTCLKAYAILRKSKQWHELLCAMPCNSSLVLQGCPARSVASSQALPFQAKTASGFQKTPL